MCVCVCHPNVPHLHHATIAPRSRRRATRGRTSVALKIAEMTSSSPYSRVSVISQSPSVSASSNGSGGPLPTTSDGAYVFRSCSSSSFRTWERPFAAAGVSGGASSARARGRVERVRGDALGRARGRGRGRGAIGGDLVVVPRGRSRDARDDRALERRDGRARRGRDRGRGRAAERGANAVREHGVSTAGARVDLRARAVTTRKGTNAQPTATRRLCCCVRWRTPRKTSKMSNRDRRRSRAANETSSSLLL